ncbi:proto-oncogene vav-like isoform X1 [Mytilus californianus]|uniref:proto-oncogene vav-like isoform X1 n=1 Tax=Mytilus californianus TaxID=6549 RepID=UPI0022453FA2|nr:proto-oncogene vav-like isoform X1 [Mytilus californianus]
MADEWRQCANWLVRCHILPDDHKTTGPDAAAFDLAQALRDGVLICHLLNNLSPNVVDLKDFSPRPQLSQFLCLKNIRTFLATCKNSFGLRDQDLFDPPDLFDVKDFRKVLHTLSKLSKTDIAQRHSKILGFPTDAPSHRQSTRRVPDEDDDIYGHLPEMAIENDLDDNEEIYDKVYQEDDEEIYEDLCSRKKHRESRVSELPPPTTKRDFCIKELYDTEKNYVDALRMMYQHFIKPLKDVIPPDDRNIIFNHIEKLLRIHELFQKEIQNAILLGKPRLEDVFCKYKTKLLIYGDYCSNLPKAQERIDDVLKRSDSIRQQVEACEKRANEGKFRLRDLLHVPMQRVLKYHLLLRELIKSTEKGSEEKERLERALEAMMDLSLYVNEVKRDNETLQLIQEIQNSIGDLQMPPNTTLKDYGRLQKDGELKVKNHVDNKTRVRYIFLFDKVMLMCKSRTVDKFFSGETYNFKEAIILAAFRVEDLPSLKEGQKKGNWNSGFILAKKDEMIAYTFYAKTDDMRIKWIEAIKLSLDNTQPPAPAGANYKMNTFDTPTECYACGKLLRGVFFQGYLCEDNKQCVHKECIGKSPTQNKGVPPVPPRVVGPKSEASAKISHVKAIVDYVGSPAPPAGKRPLHFKKDQTIKILNNSDPQWWKGSMCGDDGWFPQHLVKEEHKIIRKESYVDVKIRYPSTPNGVTPAPRPHSPLVGYVNVPNDNEMSSHLNVYKWFVGPMDRDTAVRRLTSLPNGTFLIRVSENPGRRGELSLSLKYENQVRHIRVEKSAENYYYLGDTKYFQTVPELVEFYQQNSLKECFPGVKTTLLYPIKSQAGFGATSRILGYAVAVYDYAANATSQLSLCRGDRVAILSKTGSDKGWWKGEHCTTGKVGYFPLAYVREDDEE